MLAVFALFYLLPLSAGMWLGWGTDLHFTLYDAGFFSAFTLYLLWKAVRATLEIPQAL